MWFPDVKEEDIPEIVQKASEDRTMEFFLMSVVRFGTLIDRFPNERRQNKKTRESIIEFILKTLEIPNQEEKILKMELYRDELYEVIKRMTKMYPDIVCDEMYDDYGNLTGRKRAPQIMDPINRRGRHLPDGIFMGYEEEEGSDQDEDEQEVEQEEEEDEHITLCEQLQFPLAFGKVERRLPESEKLHLPFEDHSNFREWDALDILKWVKMFITAPDHLKILETKRYSGKKLVSIMYPEERWSEEGIPFGLFIHLKSNMNRVINHHFGFTYREDYLSY
uniref:SAM domain-containing protein n=1 Tax=Caenorhabditis tropicalis TaxID=1561998 RepID=A0A1I7UXB0_9PELO